MNSILQGHLHLVREEFCLDVSLDIPAQGITGIFGHSGSGKTTLLRCIAGLERAQTAEVIINNDVWQDEKNNIFIPTYARHIGYVFQDVRLFPHLNVQQNLNYGVTRQNKHPDQKKFHHIVELLGIEHLLLRNSITLSGGEQQRVAIGRALLTSPRILLLDEPLAALDYARKKEIMPYLENLHKELDIPILYVSHSIDEIANLADYLLLMHEGSIEAQGPIEEMMTRLDVSLTKEGDAESIFEAKVIAVDQDQRTTKLHTKLGEITVSGCQGKPKQSFRIRIQAKDVTLFAQRPESSTFLNIFEAQIIEFENLGADVNLKLAVGENYILARIANVTHNNLELALHKHVYIAFSNVFMH